MTSVQSNGWIHNYDVAKTWSTGASPYHRFLLCEEVLLQERCRGKDYRLVPLKESTPSGLTLRINAVLRRTYTQIHARSIKDKHAIYSEGRSVALNTMS